jgi:hypothetical protein
VKVNLNLLECFCFFSVIDFENSIGFESDIVEKKTNNIGCDKMELANK